MKPKRFLLTCLLLVLLPAAVITLTSRSGHLTTKASRGAIELDSSEPVNHRIAGKRGQLTPAQATSIAVNRLSETALGIQLSHPRHEVAFSERGLTFVPRLGGPAWSWSGGGDPVSPSIRGATSVVYQRGGISEEYLARVDSVEQRFVLSERMDDDLVIDGVIDCDGEFETHDRGWLWRSADGGVVSLGGVTVFDARGEKLPAKMEVTERTTRISVDGMVLAGASYPVTIDPEIGTNDFRVSAMRDDYAGEFRGKSAAIAFNSSANEFLVVWLADGMVADNIVNRFDVIGQRIDAATGAFLGERQFVISPTGDDRISSNDAPQSPAVVYNPEAENYLVVWKSDRNEISGQLLNGANAALEGGGFAITDESDQLVGAPDVAYSATSLRYLVVWKGSRPSDGVATGADEILGRLVADDGELVDDESFRISDMGTDGNTGFDAANPAVAANSAGEFFVVWEGDDNTGSLVGGESEIFGQLVSGTDGGEIGTNDFRISDVGTDGVTANDATLPAIAHDPTGGQFLVVWQADEGTGSLASSEMEIYGQFIADRTGAEIGTNDFRISDFGSDDGSNDDSAEEPAVMFQAGTGDFVVAWRSSEVFDVGAAREREIFAQLIDAGSRGLVGENVRMSDMGPGGDPSFAAVEKVALVAGSGTSIMLAWSGDDDFPGFTPDEEEIFGQFATINPGLSEIGANDFRISEAGNEGDNIADAFIPAVAYSPEDNVFLVVWESVGARIPRVWELVQANRIDAASGERLHPEDIQINSNTSAGTSSKENAEPTVDYNSTANEFLIAWVGQSRGGDGFSGSAAEIFVRQMSASTGDLPGEELRISDMGTRGNSRIDAARPDIVYNAVDDHYLLVWESDSDIDELVDGEQEIYGQRLSGSDLSDVGVSDFRISFSGADGDRERDAINPAVAFDGTDYLVVWEADAGQVDDKVEIYAKRIEASTGTSTAQVKMSSTNTSTNASRGGMNPDVCADEGSFLIVWQADPVVDDQFQIFGRYAMEGAESDVFEISNSGGGVATNPACAYNPATSEFVVIWEELPANDGEGVEIHGQRLVPETGLQIGPDDFFLSDMGQGAGPDFNAHTPAIGINVSDGTFLALWSGDDDRNGHIDNEFEIYGQFYQLSTARITEIFLDGDDVIVRFRGVENVAYQLQKNADLRFSDREPGEVLSTGEMDQFVDQGGAVGTRMYYRVIVK